MKQDSNKNNKKIVISAIYCFVICIILVFSIVMFASGSIAWFASSNASNSNGLSISTEEDTDIGLKKVRILKYDQMNEIAQIIDQDVYNNMILNEYDTVFEERQINTAMILEATLENTAGKNFSVKINSTGSLFEEEDSTKIAENISNMVHFKCTASKEIATYDEEDTNLYFNVKEFFDTNVQEQQTFVNYTTTNNNFEFVENNEKSEQITFNIEREEGNRDDQVKIYILINYDNALMKEYLKRKWGSDSTTEMFSEDNKVQLLKDIQFVIFDRLA